MATTLSRGQLAGFGSDLYFHLRLLIGAVLIGGGSLLGIIIAFCLSMVGRHHEAGWVTAPFVRIPFKLALGTSFRIVSGAEYLNGVRPAVLVANHQSDLDMVLIQTVWPRFCSVVAKKQTRQRPFLGLFVKLCGAIFVERNNTSKDILTLDQAAELIQREQQSVFFFAEGTRSRATKPMLLPFKKGAFHLAVKAKVPILPVVSEIYSHTYCRQEKRFNRGEIRVKGKFTITSYSHSSLSVDKVSSVAPCVHRLSVR